MTRWATSCPTMISLRVGARNAIASARILRTANPHPHRLDRTPCAYLLLSDAYKESAVEAREHNWPVEEITGAQHLHITVDPDAVTDAIIRLTIA